MHVNRISVDIKLGQTKRAGNTASTAFTYTGTSALPSIFFTGDISVHTFCILHSYVKFCMNFFMLNNIWTACKQYRNQIIYHTCILSVYYLCGTYAWWKVIPIVNVFVEPNFHTQYLTWHSTYNINLKKRFALRYITTCSPAETWTRNM